MSYAEQILQKIIAAGIDEESARRNYSKIKGYKRGKILVTIRLFCFARRHLTPFPQDSWKFFLWLLEGDLTGKNANQVFIEERFANLRSPLFETWFEQAKINGAFDSVRIDYDGYRLVSKGGRNEERFAAAWNRGFTIDYFIKKNYGPFNPDARQYQGTNALGEAI